MPLLLISGYPCSGKTQRSEQLIQHFQAKIDASSEPRVKKLKIQHISDDTLSVSRDVYATARAEKDARATFSSAIKRDLTRDTLVIADGMNYIKGFRYQLYCEAKAVQTTNCVVHVGTPIDTCRAYYETLRSKEDADTRPAPYTPEVFENLIFRYEEPNGMTRWDAPLFTIAQDDTDPPYDAIWEALIGTDGKAKVVRPNAATVLKPASEQDYLYELDRTTSEVIAAIQAWTSDHAGEGGGEVKVEGHDEPVVLGVNPPSLPQLQRLRRQFIGLNRQHALKKERIRKLFVDYLNDAFQS